MKSALSPSEGKVLAYILACADAGRPPTTREVAIACFNGRQSQTWAMTIIKQLRKRGLVSMEDNLSRTIWPTCRLIDVADLEKAHEYEVIKNTAAQAARKSQAPEAAGGLPQDEGAIRKGVQTRMATASLRAATPA